MKRPALAKDLVPITEFRARIADWMKQVGESGRPLVVTHQGRAAAALVPPEMLDEIEEHRELVKKVLRGLKQANTGRTVADAAVWKEMESVVRRAEKRRARPLD